MCFFDWTHTARLSHCKVTRLWLHSHKSGTAKSQACHKRGSLWLKGPPKKGWCQWLPMQPSNYLLNSYDCSLCWATTRDSKGQRFNVRVKSPCVRLERSGIQSMWPNVKNILHMFSLWGLMNSRVHPPVYSSGGQPILVLPCLPCGGWLIPRDFIVTTTHIQLLFGWLSNNCITQDNDSWQF